MSKKSKGVVLDSKTPFGIGVYDDAKTRLKYQTLMQDYDELRKEADVMRSKLEASKKRKLMLAAEVRFLQRRYKYLVKTKNTNSSQEQNLVSAPNPLKRTKIIKERLLIGKEASQHRLPLVPEPNSKKKQVALCEAFPVSDQPRKKKSYSGKEAKGHGSSLISSQASDSNHKGMVHIRKELLVPNMMTPIIDRTPKKRMFGANDATLRNSVAAFDLNQDSTPSEKEASLPIRAPIFDLNEISTGDEDFQGNVEANKLEEASKSLIRGINEEQQNDLKLSICRNAGESSSRAGKRKISWQDPVALRV
ncbi:hypothetical protein C2S53_002726 [Perilla frutescens var. hirtella]|uniref:Uncharacterized protein n=1 Tax=Perilla frutescens var. hirtella TaxID=608512 RepID=A0AAD4PDH9_PERFH|nr:hypothetical protein C2S53_002726 [Perilla frutescens var. hirtella]